MTKYLYRKWGWAVTRVALYVALCAVALGVLSPGLGARIFRAPVPERKTPRAVAVLESYAAGQLRLLPVGLRSERHYL